MSLLNSARMAGILLHPTSLPSPYCIGDLGKGAYDFVDFLKKSGMRLWQILPLTPTSKGNSPYSGCSAFAGSPLLISPDLLAKDRLLSESDLKSLPAGDASDRGRVNYKAAALLKTRLLKKAYARFKKSDFEKAAELHEKFDTFVRKNSYWLSDYSLFMAIKEKHGGACWNEWETGRLGCRSASERQKTRWRLLLEDEVGYHSFVQFIFNEEWMRLKKYANTNGIRVIGDMPLFVDLDSADVWAHRSLFKLDASGRPVSKAGVPPDYFSEKGQLWGNPVYDWKEHEKQGFAWWTDRMRRLLDLYDNIRIDHFRGLCRTWTVAADAVNAADGKWENVPGKSLFLALEKKLGKDLPIIAEDLGVITPDVDTLRDSFNFPGMKVLQFAFESERENPFLPHEFTTRNCVCYTGTHDNDTTRGWYDSADERVRDKVRRYMNTDGGIIHWDFIRTCLGSVAAYAVIPMQDVLGLKSDARMNTPGVADGNWTWRMSKDDLSDDLSERLFEANRLYGRL